MEFLAVDLLKLLPHRAPFILIDKVIECSPGKSAIGIKNVTMDEPFFKGHFPTEPIFPGVLTIETIAQTTAVMYASKYLSDNALENSVLENTTLAEHVGYLVSANIKFLKPIKPGDTMRIKVQHKQTMGTLIKIEAEVSVDFICVAKGSIGVSEKS